MILRRSADALSRVGPNGAWHTTRRAISISLVLASALVCVRVAAAETNLLRNGSFEILAGGFPEGWATSLGVEPATRGSVSTDTGWTGAHSMKVDCTVYPVSPGPQSVADLQQSGFAALTAGQSYRLTFWARGANIGSSANVIAAIYHAGTGASLLTETVAVTTAWQKFEYEFIAGTDVPQAAASLSFVLKEAGTLWVDQVSVAARTASLFPNSSFEAWSGGFPTDWLYTSSPSGVTRTYTQDSGRVGSSSLKIDCTVYPGAPGSTSVADAFQYGPSVTAGSTMRVSFWAKGSNIGNPANALVRVFDTSTWAYNPLSQPINVTSTWQRFEFEFPITQNISSTYHLFWFTLTEVGTLWIDDVQYAVRDASLAANSSFETWSSGFPTSWSRTTSPAGVTVNYAADTGVFGPTALKIDCTVYPGSPTSTSHADVFQTGQTLLSGETYHLSFWAKGANIGSAANVRVKVLDVSGSYVALDQPLDVTAGAWRKFTFSFPVTSEVDGSNAKLWFQLDEVGTLWLDDVHYTKESRPTNLVGASGSFESWSGGLPAGWTALSSPDGVTVSYSADTGKVGQGVKLLCSAYPASPTSTSHADLQQRPTAWAKGTTYRLSFWAKGQNIDVANSVRVWMVDTSTWAYIPLSATFVPGATWQRFEFDVPISKNVAQPDALLWITFDEVGTLWLDEVYLTSIPSAPSRYNPVVAPVAGAVNLVPNGGFEAGADGWGTLSLPTGYSGGLTQLFGTVVTSDAYEGTHSLKISHGPDLTPTTYYDSWPSNATVQTKTLAANLGWIELKRGSEYTVSAYMKASVANTPARLSFKFSGSTTPTGTINTIERSTVVNVGTSWQRYSFTTTAMERDAFIAVGPDLTGSGISTVDFYVDAVQLEEAAAATSYAKREPVELGFETDNAYGFFDAAQTPVVRVRGSNSGGSAANVTAYLDMVDYYGQAVAQQSKAVSIPAGSTVTSNWNISLPATGYYRARLTWTANGNAHQADRRFVYLHPYRQTGGAPHGWERTQNPFGVTATVTADAPAISGLSSAKIDCTVYPGSPDSSSHADLIQFAPAVSNGSVMRLKFRAKGANIDNPAKFTVRIVDTSTWAYVPLSESPSLSGSWQEFDYSFTLTQNIAAANHLVWFTLNEVGTVWLDDVSLTQDGGANLLVNGSFEAFADSPFGINHAPVTRDSADMLRRAGLTWARTWTLNWDLIEPVEGSRDYSIPDAQLRHEVESGFNVLALAPSKPSARWSSSAPTNAGLSNDIRNAYAPTDAADLGDFISDAVDRAKSSVRHWEFLNESVWTTWSLPHSSYGFPSANYTATDYYNLLRYTANPAVKGSDPSGHFLGGFSAPASWPLQTPFFTSGGLAYVDTYTLHEYGGLEPPESFIPALETLLTTMDSNGGRKPIWITEQGYYGIDDRPWYPWIGPDGYFAANLFLASERQAADWSVRYCALMLARNVKKIFWHQGSTGEVNNGTFYTENPFGDYAGRPTKVYAGIAVLAGQLGATPVYGAALSKPGTVNGKSTSGIHGYAFDVGGKSVMVCWAEEASAPAGWTLTAPSGTVLTNAMGGAIAGLTANLGVSVVYLTSTTKTAAQLASESTLSVP